MENHKRGPILWLTAAVLLSACVIYSDARLATMAVDLGSEYMKIAIVKPGVPMEIALNKESRRKTPIIVAMKDDERYFSDPAMNVAMRHPKNAYWYLQDLLGKSADNPMVEMYKKRFPYYNYGTDEATGVLTFKIDDETSYTAEELMAMVLEQAMDTASNFAEQPIKEVVITVPAYFNQAERRAVLRAGELAGMKVLQLMNDNTAVALNYGAFRRKSFTNQTVHYMFFDMGASSTTATVVAYQVVKTKSPTTGIVDTYPQLTIKGVGFDRTLGGLELSLRLRDHLAKLFNAQKKTSDVTQNPRAMQKLLKEAGRLKQVLSANNEHYAQVEGLMDDIDFRAKVTRTEFEELCGDLFDRIGKIVKDALSSSEVTMDEIAEVILHGGGTRVPKLQEKLKIAIKREELGKGINTDEAAALGAVYHSAHLSKGFKVLKFGIKDANLYPIQVEFERVKFNDDGTEDTKLVKRTLFGRMNPYPQKKVMTFNKHAKDFGFSVNYAELGFLSDEDLQIFGNTKLEEVKLSGIADAHAKHESDDSEPKGVKAHFKMDDNGLLSLDKVEALFEKTAIVEEEEKEESTLSKIGSTISNLFGSSDKKEDEGKVEEEKPEEGEGKGKESSTETDDKPETKKEEPEEPTEKPEPTEEKEPADEENQEEEKQDKTEEKQETTEEKQETTDEGQEESDETEETAKEEDGEDSKKEETKEEEKKDEQKEEETAEEKESDKSDKKENKTEDSKDSKDSKKGDKDKKETKEKKEKKKEPKQVTIKEEITAETNIVDLQEPTDEAMKASKKKIKELRKKDEEKEKLAQAKNELESFIIATNEKMYQDEYQKCSEEEKREKITAAMNEASDWLYEQEEGTVRSVYEDKLKELKKLTKRLEERVREFKERPQAIEALNSIMNYSVHFLKNMKNFTGEDQPFTEVEYETLEKLIKETEDWNKTTWVEQEDTPLTETPKYLVEDAAYKIGSLDREVKYLVNKAKHYKPKPKPKPKTNSTEEATNKTKTKTEKKKASDFEYEGMKIEIDPSKGQQTINLNMNDFTLKSDKKQGEEDSTSPDEGEEEGKSPEDGEQEGESKSPEEGDKEGESKSPEEGDKEGEQEESLKLEGAPAEDSEDTAEKTIKIESPEEKKPAHGHDDEL